MRLLVKIFDGSSAIEPSDLELTKIERILFLQFTRRKFIRIRSLLDGMLGDESFDLASLVQKLREQRSSKRIEERKKFVFKHVMKYLKKTYEISSTGQTPVEKKKGFYEFYFSRIALKKKLDLFDFFDPLDGQKKARVHKTLSKEYLYLLFESENFKTDFMCRLESNAFIEAYQSRIKSKLAILLQKWEEMLRSGHDEETVIQTVNDYFNKNKQCKLPWTIQEIMHAISSFKTFLKKY